MPIQNDAKKLKMTETQAYWYSSESAQRELSYEYPYDIVTKIFITFCILVNWTKLTTASEGLMKGSRLQGAVYDVRGKGVGVSSLVNALPNSHNVWWWQ